MKTRKPRKLLAYSLAGIMLIVSTAILVHAYSTNEDVPVVEQSYIGDEAVVSTSEVDEVLPTPDGLEELPIISDIAEEPPTVSDESEGETVAENGLLPDVPESNEDVGNIETEDIVIDDLSVDSGYMGIMPTITIPPSTAVIFLDYTGEVMVVQFHTDTVGVAPYMGVYIGGIRPEHWDLHSWGIIYTIMDDDAPGGHRLYDIWYDVFPADYVLMHRLPDSICYATGVWHMLPTFRIRLTPVPPVLTGTVTCEVTGREIPDVRINLYDDEGTLIAYRVTDGNGFFDFGEIPIGDLEVVMIYETIPEDYQTDLSQISRSLTTSPGGVYEEHFLVRPLDPPTLTKTITHVNGEVYDGEPVDVGDVITYLLTVNNPNRRNLNNFLVRDILPECLALNVDSVVVSPGSALATNASAGNTLEVVLNLPSGNTTITYTAVVTTVGRDYIENIAIIYGPPGDDGERDEVDRDSEEVPMVEMELPTLNKTITQVNGVAHDGSAVDIGDVITYVLTVNNPNLRVLENHLVRDVLPAGLVLDVESVVVQPAGALLTNNSAANTVAVILNLSPGNTTITFDAEVTEEASETIVNISIIYGPPDDDGDRDEVDRDREEVPVVGIRPPSLAKAIARVNGEIYTGAAVEIGDVITYAITVTNPNRRTLENFSVVDALPLGLALDVDSVQVIPPEALVSNTTGENTVRVVLNLPPGNTVIAFTAVVTDAAQESIRNVARLYDPDGRPVDEDDVTVEVKPPGGGGDEQPPPPPPPPPPPQRPAGPQTGDDSSVLPWVLLMLNSVVALGIIVVHKKTTRVNKK